MIQKLNIFSSFKEVQIIRNGSNVAIQKICLQLGNLGLNWGQICPKNYE